MYLPPVPTWDGLHPLIIHFPIGLLMVAPVFIALGTALQPKRSQSMLIAALILMVLGTVSVFIAVETGEAAGKLAERTPQINAVLERHESLAETTRVVFSILTTLFAALLILPRLLKYEISRRIHIAASLIFLFVYGSAVVVLVNTAHQGGMLVHQYGVRALVAPDPNAPAPVAEPREGD